MMGEPLCARITSCLRPRRSGSMMNHALKGIVLAGGDWYTASSVDVSDFQTTHARLRRVEE